MTDIVEQMRAYADEFPIKDTGAWIDFASFHLAKGADEITRLRAENERLRAGNDDMRHTIHQWEPDKSALRAENKRLRAALARMLLEFDFMVERGVIPDVRNDIIFVEARAALGGDS